MGNLNISEAFLFDTMSNEVQVCLWVSASKASMVACRISLPNVANVHSHGFCCVVRANRRCKRKSAQFYDVIEMEAWRTSL